MTYVRGKLPPMCRSRTGALATLLFLECPPADPYCDRVDLRGGLTLHYKFVPLQNLLFVGRVVAQIYANTTAGV
jgi:hypothetical protein